MLYYLASVYGSGSYDSSNYNGAGTSNGSLLTNTGFDLTLIVTVACLLACTALIVRVWKRKPLNQ
jgi:hypothetical protein